MSHHQLNPRNLQNFYQEFIELKEKCRGFYDETGKAMFVAAQEFEDVKRELHETKIENQIRLDTLEMENKELRTATKDIKTTNNELKNHNLHLESQNIFLTNEVNNLKNTVSSLINTNSITTPFRTEIQSREPRLNDPEVFSGNRKKSKYFILQCRNIFLSQPTTYSNDSAKVSFIISFLRGPAFEWISPYLESNDACLADLDSFLELFHASFSDIDRKVEVEKRLTEIKQENRNVSTLVAEFQRLAVESKWPETVLFQLFYRSLNSSLKDEMYRYDRPETIEEYYKMAVRLDNRLTERKLEKKEDNIRYTTRTTPKPDVDAMVIGTSQLQLSNNEEVSDSGSQQSRRTLTVEERRYRQENKLCVYCADPGHRIDNCAQQKSRRNPKKRVFRGFLEEF
jgi:hypothetical protein